MSGLREAHHAPLSDYYEASGDFYQSLVAEEELVAVPPPSRGGLAAAAIQEEPWGQAAFSLDAAQSFNASYRRATSADHNELESRFRAAKALSYVNECEQSARGEESELRSLENRLAALEATQKAAVEANDYQSAARHQAGIRWLYDQKQKKITSEDKIQRLQDRMLSLEDSLQAAIAGEDFALAARHQAGLHLLQDQLTQAVACGEKAMRESREEQVSTRGRQQAYNEEWQRMIVLKEQAVSREDYIEAQRLDEKAEEVSNLCDLLARHPEIANRVATEKEAKEAMLQAAEEEAAADMAAWEAKHNARIARQEKEATRLILAKRKQEQEVEDGRRRAEETRRSAKEAVDSEKRMNAIKAEGFSDDQFSQLLEKSLTQVGIPMIQEQKMRLF